jgi:ABC-type sugar transport system substrate-binding protein
MRRRDLLATSAAVVAIAATAIGAFLVALSPSRGGRDEPDGVSRLIGVSHANLTEPWRVAMNGDILEAASGVKGLRVAVTDAGDSATKQVEDISRLLRLGIDLLIVSPVDGDALTPAVSAAHDKVPVILLDRAVEGYGYTLYIGPDNNFIGRSLGACVAEMLGPRGGRVVEIQGRSGSPPALERSAGLRAELSGMKGVSIVDSFGADWLRDRAEDKFAERLGSLGSVDIVVAQNDTMAYGAWRAARDRGLRGIRFVGVDGFSGENGGIDLVRRGILAATFASATGGRAAVEYAMDILDGVQGVPKKIFLSTRKVTREGLQGETGSWPQARHAAGEGAAKGSATRRIVLGYAQTGKESDWRAANTVSIQKAARSAGIDLRFVDCELKQENQIAAIRSFIAQKVDVIALSPLVEPGWDQVLSEAKAAGIPVILSDRTISSSDETLYATFLGADFEEEGRRAARWLVERMGEHRLVNIVELRGTEGAAPAIGRKSGFEEIIGATTGYRIVASENGDFRRSEGTAAMNRILDRYHGRIDAVFAHNDDMALGAIQAMERRGLHPGSDIVVVSMDGVRAAFEAMIAGKLNCTVECNPLLGPILMKAVKDYMDGKDLPRQIITSEGIFPASVARETLPKRSY